MTWRAHDITGNRYGRVVAISRAENTKDGKAMWVCQCDCGALTCVRAAALKNGTSKSCGCMFRELSSMRSRSHGMTSSREYETWRRMKQRCEDRRDGKREHYYDRGIVVCERWLCSFENFYADMGTTAVERPLNRQDRPEWQLRTWKCQVGDDCRTEQQQDVQQVYNGGRRDDDASRMGSASWNIANNNSGPPKARVDRRGGGNHSA